MTPSSPRLPYRQGTRGEIGAIGAKIFVCFIARNMPLVSDLMLRTQTPLCATRRLRSSQRAWGQAAREKDKRLRIEDMVFDAQAKALEKTRKLQSMLPHRPRSAGARGT